MLPVPESCGGPAHAMELCVAAEGTHPGLALLVFLLY